MLECVCVCVCVCVLLFTSLSTIFQSYHDAGFLLHKTVANTDAPCRIHKRRVHHQVTLSWHRANQSWFYPLNSERLARNQQLPSLTPLVWRDRGSYPRPPNAEANALFTQEMYAYHKHIRGEVNWYFTTFLFQPYCIKCICGQIQHLGELIVPGSKPASRWDKQTQSWYM